MNLYSGWGNWRKGFWPVISKFLLLSGKSTRKRVLSPGKGGCPPLYPQPGPQAGLRAGWLRTGTGSAMTPRHAASIRRSGTGQAVVAYGRECRTRSEAPPRMRWRGLAAAIQQGYRLLGYRGYCPVAPPGRENQPGVPVSRLSAHPPRRSGFPVRRSAGVQLISIFGGAEFLPLAAGRRKDFWPGIYEFCRYEQLFHTSGLVIPRAGRLSTGSSTARSTTRRGGGRPGGPVAGGPATGSGSARRTVLRWTGGAPLRDGPRDQAVPRSPGRGSHPGRARCGSWGWR